MKTVSEIKKLANEAKRKESLKKYGTPVLISQGKHSLIDPPKKKSDRPTPVLISQGKHSRIDEEREEPKVHDHTTDAVRHLEHENVHGLGKELEAHADHPSNQNLEHIVRYTSGSKTLNRELYNQHINDPDSEPDRHIGTHDVHGLDAALKHKTTDRPLTVFSGVKWHPGHAAQQNSQRKVFLPAYTSTSLRPHVAVDFAEAMERGTSNEYDSWESHHGPDNHMLKIHVPKGHHGSYVGDSSKYKEEKEFLLPRRTTLKIDPHPEVQHYRHDMGGKNGRVHIWNAHVVPHED